MFIFIIVKTVICRTVTAKCGRAIGDKIFIYFTTIISFIENAEHSSVYWKKWIACWWNVISLFVHKIQSDWSFPFANSSPFRSTSGGLWIFMTLTVARSIPFYVPFINCYCPMTNVVCTELIFFQYRRETRARYCDELTQENFHLLNIEILIILS